MTYSGVAILGILAVIFFVVVIWRMMSVDTSPASNLPPFRMTIDDVIGENTLGSVVVAGVVSKGEVKPGDVLFVTTCSGRIRVIVESLEAYDTPLFQAKAGGRVEIVLTGANHEQISPYDVLAAG